MRTSNRRLPKRGQIRLAAALIILVCFEPLLIDARTALAAQKSAAELPSRNRSKNQSKGQPVKDEESLSPPREEGEVTRPRRVDSAKSYSGNGPVIRVALMTDVTAVAITSSSSLVVYDPAASRDNQKPAGNQVRVELRHHTSLRKQVETARLSTYTVEVASVEEPKQARKITDDLRKKFRESPQTVYDSESRRYRIFIGRFDNRSDAAQMQARLRLAGYNSTRVASQESASKRDALKDGAKENTTSQILAQMVAFDAGQMIASTSDRMIIAPAASDDSTQRRKDAEAQKQDEARAGTAPAVRVNNKDYRGEIHLVLSPRGRINVVNAVAMEDYLRGVVPLELPPAAFPAIEALKAQAVAARTYAIERRGQYNKEGFDLYDTARSQVYGGISAERELSNRAVEQTRGMVAVYVDDHGKAAPIQALYSSTCGGRTENNEDAFGGKPLPYLRSVACALDRQTLAGRDIISARTTEPLVSDEGRAITREIALAEVFGFQLPRRVTNDYLRGLLDQLEARTWLDHAARIAGSEKPQTPQREITRLATFARAVASAIYGEGRASFMLSPADVDYLLAGIAIDTVPTESRAEIALLLKSGALRLSADGTLKASAAITRGYALEIIIRAIYLKSQAATNSLAMASLYSQTAQASESGRLIIASGSPAKTQSAPRESRYTTTNAINSSGARQSKEAQSPDRAAREIITQEVAFNQTRTGSLDGIEIETGARLFRVIGGESYPVDRLTIAGGERVTYHLNATGRVDFLEAFLSERSLASDRVSSAAEWRERLSADELRQRLARSRINVGQITDLVPVSVSSSSRVIELEVIGDAGRALLRSSQIRNALGLKETLFVIDRERDAEGRLAAIVFTGRGWGHGVGLCQTGAFGLAKEGYSYIGILQKYYTGVKVQKMY